MGAVWVEVRGLERERFAEPQPGVQVGVDEGTGSHAAACVAV